MRTFCGRLIIGGVLAAAALAASSYAEGTAMGSQLQSMLDQVPLGIASLKSDWATVRFTDFEALFESEGLSLLRSLGSPDLLMNSVPLGAILGRISAGPRALSYVLASTGEMKDAVGFEWLVDVDRGLEFGDAPDFGLLLGGEFDAALVSSTLEGRGFELREIEDVEVWHRFDDLSLSLAACDLADPFGGDLGAAARIALLPETLANARTWQLIEAIICASQGAELSLADDPAYRALAEAISEPGGLLLQALFFSEAAVRTSGNSIERGQQVAGNHASLPEFSVAVLADRQEGDEQVHLIGLACADESAAQIAADVLAERVEEFHQPDQPENVLASQFGATVSIRDVRRTDDATAIAVVAARYPLPDERTDPETGLYNTRAPLFRAWVHAILYREFTPLW